VDKRGNYQSVTEESLQTTHGPDDGNIWTCRKCGAEAVIPPVHTISFSTRLRTDLVPDSLWVSYQAKGENGSDILDSWIIAPNYFQDNQIKEIIDEYIYLRDGIDKFPAIADLCPDLARLIQYCDDSDNEMFFVEPEEAAEYSESAIKHNIERFNLGEYIVFNHDGTYITVYGGIAQAVNYKECPKETDDNN
jgi:hypothetical protein